MQLLEEFGATKDMSLTERALAAKRTVDETEDVLKAKKQCLQQIQ